MLIQNIFQFCYVNYGYLGKFFIFINCSLIKFYRNSQKQENL